MTSATLTREQRACLLFSLLQTKVGYSVVSRLGDTSLADAAEMSGADFTVAAGTTERVARLMAEVREGFDAPGMLEALRERGIDVVTLADEDYPDGLRGSPDPPPALYVEGELRDEAAVAVVGSRKATRGSLALAEKVGAALAGRGACVVSGLALGVDAAAHRGALSAGGRTVGVLGCGIDVVYPRGNRGLFERMRSEGAVVSEYYLGESPLAWRFPARNRIISSLVQTVLIVEAAERSGALITARHALDSGRDVWAAPGPVGLSECRGSNRLLADGASVLWDVDEFVEAVAPRQTAMDVKSRGGSEKAEKRRIPEGLPAGEALALRHVGFAATGADDVAAASGMGMSQLLASLTMLELKGYVGREASGAFYRKGG